MKKFIDPTFKAHELLAKVFFKILIHIADSVILPLNCNSYAIELNNLFESLNTNYKDKLFQYNITLQYLYNAITTFENKAKDFHLKLKKVDNNKYCDLTILCIICDE